MFKMGIEPTTSGVLDQRSPTELLEQLCYFYYLELDRLPFIKIFLVLLILSSKNDHHQSSTHTFVLFYLLIIKSKPNHVLCSTSISTQRFKSLKSFIVASLNFNCPEDSFLLLKISNKGSLEKADISGISVYPRAL